jgi:2-oxoglutarate ferredoxin oxidoreductase subunit delta
MNKRYRVEIDSEGCKGCKYCINFCPAKCLTLSKEFNNKGVHYAIFMEDGGGNKKCNGCGVCYIVCPDYCIKVVEVV